MRVPSAESLPIRRRARLCSRTRSLWPSSTIDPSSPATAFSFLRNTTRPWTPYPLVWSVPCSLTSRSYPGGRVRAGGGRHIHRHQQQGQPECPPPPRSCYPQKARGWSQRLFLASATVSRPGSYPRGSDGHTGGRWQGQALGLGPKATLVDCESAPTWAEAIASAPVSAQGPAQAPDPCV